MLVDPEADRLSATSAPPPPASTDPDGWSRVTAADGTAIAWRGDGPVDAPTVVLCNGIACDDGYWSRVWPRLADGVRVVRWHYRGHGRSARPADPAGVTVATVVEDLLAVLEAAGAGSAVLVGHSYGVQVVCEAYRVAPRRVDGLVAVAGGYGHPLGTVRGRDPAAVVGPVVQRLLTPTSRMAAPLVRAGLRSPLSYWAGRAIGGVGPRAPRPLLRGYFDHVAALELDVLVRMLLAMQAHTSVDVLPTITVPTTVVAGSRDGMTPPRVARRMADTVPGARLVELPAATHVLPIEEPGAVADEILAVVAAARRDRRAP